MDPYDWPEGSGRSKVELKDPRDVYGASIEEVRKNAGDQRLPLDKMGISTPWCRIPSHRPPDPFVTPGNYEIRFDND